MTYATPANMPQFTAAEPPKDYSWAEYLDFMEGGADILTVPPATKEPKTKAAQAAASTAKTPIWGFILSFAIMFAAIFLSELPFKPFTIIDAKGKATHPIEPVM